MEKIAESKTKAGKMKNQLYNQITAEKIKSKTSDAAITKSFRLLSCSLPVFSILLNSYTSLDNFFIS